MYVFSILLFISCFFLSCGGTWWLIRLFRRHQVLDIPNDRSNHAVPVPVGGGIAVVASILVGMIATSIFTKVAFSDIWPIIGCSIALALISSWDDMRKIPVIWRLVVQLAAVLIGTMLIALDGPLFQDMLPRWLDIMLTVGIWLWFVNLFNFMDGIDGITGVETATIGIGIGIVTLVAHLAPEWLFYSIAIVAAALGFLVWNWQPAKIFLGDVGSIPLGYLLGFLLLKLAIQDYWLPALILPSYYLADSTFTLLKRLWQRKPVWQAHSEHFYQQAARAGQNHSSIVKSILVANIWLLVVVLAAVAQDPRYWYATVGLAAAVVLVLLAWMRLARINN